MSAVPVRRATVAGAAVVLLSGVLVLAGAPSSFAAAPTCLDAGLTPAGPGVPRDNGDGTVSVVLVGQTADVAVPVHVTRVVIDVCGAKGEYADAGRGGRMRGIWSSDQVGGSRLSVVAGNRTGTVGAGGAGPGGAGAGGGYSGVFLGDASTTGALVVAGGGGGAAGQASGGYGGGTAGADGAVAGATGGGGGTQTAPGRGGAGVLGAPSGSPGVQLQGGAGAFTDADSSGGGGGGGWYGGGGGGSSPSGVVGGGGGGGGGSGYSDRERITELQVQSDAHEGTGAVVLTWAKLQPSPAPSTSASATATRPASPVPGPTSTATASSAPTSSATPSASPSSPAPSSPAPTATAAGRFHPLTPARVLDTRREAPGPVLAGQDRQLRLTGRGGVPREGVTAVILNVTVTGGSQASNLQVYPVGARPEVRTSNVNWAAGRTVPVQIQIGVGEDGAVMLSVGKGRAHVVVDVFGYYGDDADPVKGTSGYTALRPHRLLDTRTSGEPVSAAQDRVVQVTGLAGVPSEATAVALNATLLDTPGAADLQVFPTGRRPEVRTSNLNAVRGQTKANAVVSAIGRNGRISLSISQGTGSVVLDVLGYYSPDRGAQFVPLQPRRLLDTRRPGQGPAVSAGAERRVALSDRGGIPAQASAAVLSVTVAQPSRALDVQLFPTGDRPSRRTSTLNTLAGEEVANLSVATLGVDGSSTIAVSHGVSHVVVDVLGYFAE